MAEQIVKLKKKQWYPIIAPKQFDNIVIGETLVYEPNAMLGKTLSHSLMNLTNDTKRQNINIHFKVVEIDNDQAKTRIIGYEIIPSSVKRFVRRSSEKMDISFNCETADNIFLRVKPLVIARADVKGSIATKLRNNIASYLAKTIKKAAYDEVINDLITHKLQSVMKKEMDKIYPLKVCEIRYLGIGAREKPQEAKTEAKEEQQKQ